MHKRPIKCDSIKKKKKIFCGRYVNCATRNCALYILCSTIKIGFKSKTFNRRVNHIEQTVVHP